MAGEEKSANQFISALVKNLQAVCHGHVEFDQNVKVVGHLYLTVDSSTEFNYILNEKVSKSDESSTTFVSKSFYATDPQQKTQKKNPERPFPSPTPNVLGKTRFDISVDLTDEQPQGATGGRTPQQRGGQFAQPRGGYQMNRNPPTRRRPYDQRVSPQMAKMARLSSPMRHPMTSPSGSGRRIPQNTSQRSPATSSATSPSISSETRTDVPPPSSIPPESVSATPAQSLPGADRPETEVGKHGEKGTAESEKDMKFEVIKVENGSIVAGENDSGKGELRIESVTSHDLSLSEMESTTEKQSESKSETSDCERPSPNPPALPSSSSEGAQAETSQASPSSSSKNDPDVIEIDLTKVKDEGDSTYESDASYMFDDSGMQQFPSGAQGGGGDNSLSSFGGESNDEDFFASLREQTVGLYPVGLHANESNNPGQNFQPPDVPNVQGSQGASYLPAGGAGTSSQSNQPGVKVEFIANECLWCQERFLHSYERSKHEYEMHGIYDGKTDKTYYECPYCTQLCLKKNIKEHIKVVHFKKRFRCHLCDKKYIKNFDLKLHMKKAHCMQ